MIGHSIGALRLYELGAPPNVNRLHSDPMLCLFGAAGGGGNLGVSALGEATLHSLSTFLPNARLLPP